MSSIAGILSSLLMSFMTSSLSNIVLLPLTVSHNKVTRPVTPANHLLVGFASQAYVSGLIQGTIKALPWESWMRPSIRKLCASMPNLLSTIPSSISIKFIPSSYGLVPTPSPSLPPSITIISKARLEHTKAHKDSTKILTILEFILQSNQFVYTLLVSIIEQ